MISCFFQGRVDHRKGNLLSRLVIRVDAGSSIGAGHLTRCLSLAREWEDQQGRATFVTFCEGEALRSRISGSNMECVSLDAVHPDPSDLAIMLATLRRLASEDPASHVKAVLDGYHFDSEYQKAIRAAGFRLLCIDDLAHLPYYPADIIVNQNIQATELDYHCDPGCKLLLGTQYAIIRHEFKPWLSWKRSVPDVGCKLLVTLGAGDVMNATAVVVSALEWTSIPNLEVVLVAGPANPHVESLRHAIDKHSSYVRLMWNVHNMAELMAWADFAVVSTGTTFWETSLMQLPSLVIVQAEYMWATASRLVRYGLADALDASSPNFTPERIGDRLTRMAFDRNERLRLIEGLRTVTDGKGAARVVSVLTELD